jgi:hypothetical protein
VAPVWSGGGGKMNEELMTKLLEYIDAAIDAQSAKTRDYLDGGMIEERVKYRVRDELFELINKEEAK